MSSILNILFKSKIAGSDLKEALLSMVNCIKEELSYPEVFEYCDITTIFKKKGSRNNFENYRGIFGTSVFRYIIDRLIYNDEYKEIDENLTDANVGCRKGRNIRDNIFVINAITNAVMKNKSEKSFAETIPKSL